MTPSFFIDQLTLSSKAVAGLGLTGVEPGEQGLGKAFYTSAGGIAWVTHSF